MLEAFQNLERITVDFAPEVLVIGGLVCMIIGLYLWLGGLRLSRVAAGFLGVLAGCLWAFFLTGRQTAAFVSMGLVVGVFAMFFDKAALVAAGAVTAVMIVLIIFAGPLLSKSEGLEYPESTISSERERAAKGTTLIKESIESAKIQLVFFVEEIGQAVSGVPVKAFIISAVAGLAVATLGYFMPQFISALTCSVLGTGIIAVGMILLLLYKGAQPITRIYVKANIYNYNTVVLAMAGFGNAVQLLLYSARERKLAIKRRSDGEK
jgi:hypothetical protein